jgi:hypothetical protein
VLRVHTIQFFDNRIVVLKLFSQEEFRLDQTAETSTNKGFRDHSVIKFRVAELLTELRPHEWIRLIAIGHARKAKTRVSIASEAGLNDLVWVTCGPDGTRTRDLRRDRAAF